MNVYFTQGAIHVFIIIVSDTAFFCFSGLEFQIVIQNTQSMLHLSFSLLKRVFSFHLTYFLIKTLNKQIKSKQQQQQQYTMISPRKIRWQDFSEPNL